MYLELILSSDVAYICPNLLSEVFLLKLPGDVYGWNYGPCGVSKGHSHIFIVEAVCWASFSFGIISLPPKNNCYLKLCKTRLFWNVCNVPKGHSHIFLMAASWRWGAPPRLLLWLHSKIFPIRRFPRNISPLICELSSMRKNFQLTGNVT